MLKDLAWGKMRSRCPEEKAPQEQEEVAFIRYKNLLRVIQSYHPMKEILVAVEPGGRRLATMHISDGIWIALFDRPETAPKCVIRKDDPVLGGLSSDVPEDVLAWREFYGRR